MLSDAAIVEQKTVGKGRRVRKRADIAHRRVGNNLRPVGIERDRHVAAVIARRFINNDRRSGLPRVTGYGCLLLYFYHLIVRCLCCLLSERRASRSRPDKGEKQDACYCLFDSHSLFV